MAVTKQEILEAGLDDDVERLMLALREDNVALKALLATPMTPDKYVMHYPGDVVVTFVRQDP